MDPAMEPMQGRRFETADKHVGSSFVANQTLKTLNQTLKTLETLKTLGSEARNRAQLSELEVLGKKGSNLERGSSNGGSITETDSNPGETEGAGSAFNSTKVAKGQGISERNPDEATGSKRGAPSPLRVTFQFFDQMYPMETGAHRDFEGMDRSLLDQFNVTCPEGAATCPDVIILSPAMAYALWKQNGSDFEVGGFELSRTGYLTFFFSSRTFLSSCSFLILATFLVRILAKVAARTSQLMGTFTFGSEGLNREARHRRLFCEQK